MTKDMGTLRNAWGRPNPFDLNFFRVVFPWAFPGAVGIAEAWDFTFANPGGGGGCDNCSCVIAGTHVQMADGSFKPVEAIAKDDLLADGLGGVVRALGSHRTTLGDRTAYAVNGVAMTADHPVKTPTGWAVRDINDLRRQVIVVSHASTFQLYSMYDAISHDLEVLDSGATISSVDGPITASVAPVTLPAETEFFTPLTEDGGTFVAGGLVLGSLRVFNRIDG